MIKDQKSILATFATQIIETLNFFHYEINIIFDYNIANDDDDEQAQSLKSIPWNFEKLLGWWLLYISCKTDLPNDAAGVYRSWKCK